MMVRVLLALLALSLLGASPARAEIRIGIAAPLTGHYAWNGDQVKTGAERAIHDLNERGGVLGEPLSAVVVDDFCNPDQAVAAAQKLVQEGVPFVVGHQCSGAAIPASSLYEEAGIILISPAATNPQLTDRGLHYTFRTSGRDDLQGTMIADYLAEKWPGANIALVHDGQAYGRGIAEETRRRLDQLGIETALLEQVEPGQTEFSDLVAAFEVNGIDVVFYGGYQAEAGLIIRQAKARIPKLEFVLPDGVTAGDFALIAGDALEGTPMTYFMDAPRQPAAAELAASFKSIGFEAFGDAFYTYAAVQAWAQAVEHAGSTDATQVAKTLRAEKFDTVLGRIGFDDKGDVTGFGPFAWYVWTNGTYVPMDPAELSD
jgi:branched-chain amino acid transport system substrate-binding protein